jgi:hypothetical protein
LFVFIATTFLYIDNKDLASVYTTKQVFKIIFHRRDVSECKIDEFTVLFILYIRSAF